MRSSLRVPVIRVTQLWRSRGRRRAASRSRRLTLLTEGESHETLSPPSNRFYLAPTGRIAGIPCHLRRLSEPDPRLKIDDVNIPDHCKLEKAMASRATGKAPWCFRRRFQDMRTKGNDSTKIPVSGLGIRNGDLDFLTKHGVNCVDYPKKLPPITHARAHPASDP